MNLEVLNVDDDRMVLFIHEKMMIQSEFSSSPKSFFDPHEALAYISQHSNSTKFVIFLDVNMPDISGWDFLEELKKQDLYRHCYVFVVTSSIDSSDKERAATYDAAIGFVEKPLSVERLKELKSKEELSAFFE